jgi:hypothetical protein
MQKSTRIKTSLNSRQKYKDGSSSISSDTLFLELRTLPLCILFLSSISHSNGDLSRSLYIFAVLPYRVALKNWPLLRLRSAIKDVNALALSLSLPLPLIQAVMRGALPGSILILVATILLALVTFSVPIIKSIAFLTAKIGGTGSEKGETFTFGALGYCVGSTCEGPTIGYSFDPTQLLGIATSVEGINVDSSKYSTAVIKGLTYTLVLHPIALAACVLTLLTGILANCGDLSLKCLNSVFSSLASVVTLIATGCDFALFVIAEKRINNVNGASASLGNALWMTLIAWICIFLSSFFFCCGSSGRGNGGSSRKNNKNRDEYDDDAWKSGGRSANGYPDQMRMDALAAENQRKNQLPQFAVYETEHIESVPLKHDYEDQMGAGHAVGYSNAGVGAAGQGYGNQYGYADGGYADYTPGSEHAPYGGYPPNGGGARGSLPMDSFIPGVGPGAQRTVAPAGVYHDPQYAQDGPSTYPGYHDDESSYSHGTPAHAASWASHMNGGPQDSDGYGGMESIPPVPSIPAHMQQQSSYREPSNSSPDEHSYGYNTSSSPYEAIQQVTAAGQRSRALPNAPAAVSPHADNDFGVGVLQAGAAAAAVNNSSYDNQSMSPTGMRSPSGRALPTAPTHQEQFEPPEYSSEHGAYQGVVDDYSRHSHPEKH